MAMSDKELITEIRKCRLADLSDGMDALGLVNAGSMSTEMRPIRPGIAFAGFAKTVKLVPTQKKDFKAFSTPEEYLKENGKWCGNVYQFDRIIAKQDVKDHVLVIDQGGHPAGVLGSDNMMKYKLNGIVGAVVDGGGCRDSYECNLEEVNAFTTKRSFHHATWRLEHGDVDIPVECAGVTVHPQDVVCADDDGVLVIPRGRAEEVLKFALRILELDIEARSKKYQELGLASDESLKRLG
jgi:4-hydroxy-4-methyl-2-oxoglutarate aldolase